MYIGVDHNSGVPVSTQIVDQVKYLVVAGKLRPYEKMPSVRGLAAELKLNPTTVARVYRVLEREGIIFTQRGLGTFIAARESGLTEAEKARRIGGEIRNLVVEAGRLGLGYDVLLSLLQREIEELHGDDIAVNGEQS